MEIIAGCKQTEVGIIPEDWDLRFFGEMASVRKQTYDSRKSGAHDFCIELEHIGQGTGTLLGHSETSIRSSMKRVFDKNDVLFGRLRAYLRKYWLASKPGVASSEIWPLVANPDVTIPEYVFQIVQTNNFIDAASETYGTHMPRSDWNVIKTLRVPVPRIQAEQTAIAEALSDADSLIASLEKLIAKKQNIKLGAMQLLLTGKKRLPGFSGEWETKQLGEIFSISAGGDLIKASFSSLKDDEHCYPIYSNSLSNHGLYGYSSEYRYQENCVTVTARGTIGVANARDHKFDAIGRVLILKPICKLSCFFMSEYLNNRVSFSIESTGVPQLTAPQISKYEVMFPNPDEQTAIAQVLSDMDADMEILEHKLVKYKLIKQGMMQELLTGKKRLI